MPLTYKLSLLVLLISGCANLMTVIDFTASCETCPVHDCDLETEITEAFAGTISYQDPLEFEPDTDLFGANTRFPYANERPVALRNSAPPWVKSARISFCSRCRAERRFKIETRPGKKTAGEK